MRALKPGGFGRFIWPNDPLADVVRDGSASAFERPLDAAAWSSLIKAGHRTELHLQLDGIPWIFPQRTLLDVRGRELQAPADYQVCPALFVDPGADFALDADRQSGVAAGRAVDVVLAWQALEDYGLLGELFADSIVSGALTDSIDTADASSFPVTPTTGYEAGRGYYVGHEYIVPASVGTSSLEGVRRGVCGRPYYHTSESGAGWRYVTDRPTFWRRRLVTIWEVLVSPEGRALGGQYATIGPYVRQFWRGFVDDDEPRDEAAGMTLRCLPLVRMLTEEIGVKLGGEVNFDAQGFPYPMAFGPEDQVRIRELAGSMADAIGPNNPGNITIGSLQTWCAIAAQNLEADVSPDTVRVWPRLSQWAIDFHCVFAGETYHAFDVYPSGCWFLPQDNFTAVTSQTEGGVRIPLAMNRPGCWLPVRFALDADANLALLPETGTGILEVGGVQEMVTWDEVRRDPSDESLACLRLNGRGIGGQVLGFDRAGNGWTGTTHVDWTLGGSFKIVTGARGNWAQVLLTLATSSGLSGVRGAYDTLPVGFGLGLDLEDFDEPSLDRMDSPELEVFAEDRSSIASMLGGWCALQRRCLVQRLGDDGRVRIAVVSTEPSADTTATELGTSEVLIGGHGKPTKAPAANRVSVVAGLGSSARKYIINGLAAQQARGADVWEVRAPGISEPEARAYALAIMRLARGQTVLDLELAPWSRIQIGDSLALTTASPRVYSWADGMRAPTTINARVVGVGPRVGGARRVTLLLAGLASLTRPLAPAPIVKHIDGDRHLFRIDLDQARWFAEGETIHIYNPGGEAAGESQDNTILEISLGDTEAAITIANPELGSWAVAGTTRITFPLYTSASARQGGFMFVRANRYWV